MRRFLLCLSLAACADPNGPRDDVSLNPMDELADAGSPTSTPPLLDGGRRGEYVPPDASRLPDARVDATMPPGPLGSDYRQKGPQQVSRKQDTFKGDVCSFGYETFTPATAASEVQVVLAPGFALAAGIGGSREAMSTLATQIASWGVAVHTVDLCTNGGMIDHPKNGAAIAELGEKLASKGVIYAGFSAGGLDGLLAAAKAKNTAAFLALDAVNNGDLAKPALDSLRKPVYALAGEPSSCNDDEKMLKVYEGRKLPVLKVNKAQHFIFEGTPCQGIKCLPCNGGGEPEANAVRALATAYVLGISGVDKHALSWWEAGSAGFNAVSAGGVVSVAQ